MTRPNEPAEHDAYLRSALRHAPDAALVPSDALNEAILQRARSAMAPVSRPSLASAGADVRPGSNGRRSRSATTTTRWHRLAALCAWFGQPAVATGFAGLMVATLVGVMWWDRPLDEAMAPRSERRAAAELAARASAPPVKQTAEERAFDPADAARVPTQASAVDARATARKTDRLRQDNAIAMADQPRQSVRQAPSSPGPVAPAPSARNRTPAEPGGLAAAVPSPSDAATAERVPQAFPSPPQRSGEALNGAPEAAAKSRAAEPSAMADAVAAQGRVAEAPIEPGRAPARAPTPAATPTPAHADAQPQAPAVATAERAPAKAEAQAPATAQAHQQTQIPGTLSREAPPPPTAAGATAAAGPAPVQPTSESAARAATSRRGEAVSNAEPLFDERREQSRSESSPNERLALRELSKGTALRSGNSPLSTLRAAVSSEPRRWTWTTEDGSVRPVSSELQRWLARLEAAAVAFADAAPAAAGAIADPKDAPRADRQAPARTLTLLRDGQRHTTLRIGDSVEAIVEEAGSERWQARLAPQEAAALRSSVPDR